MRWEIVLGEQRWKNLGCRECRENRGNGSENLPPFPLPAIAG